MEKLTHLMQLIDENSDALPEGVYLNMCNDMKEVHDNMKDVDGRDSQYATFSQVRYEEIEYDLHRVVKVMEKLKIHMKRYKPRMRMSTKMKKEAIMEWADHMMLDSLREYTEEALLENTNITDVKFIYNWYLDIYNERNYYKKENADIALADLIARRDELVNDLADEIAI
jgi:hypothetical protein